MSAASRSRGRPLAVLSMLLVGYVAARVMLWEPSGPTTTDRLAPQLASLQQSYEPPAALVLPPVLQVFEDSEAEAPVDAVRIELPPVRTAYARQMTGTESGLGAADRLDMDDPQSMSRLAAAGGHQMLFMAAMSHLPVPPEVEEALVSAAGPDLMQPSQRAVGKRWSVDSWALWRQGSGSQLVSLGRAPTYGASQAGAVFNYRLTPDNRRDPRAYLRAYKALINNGESELAAGLSARPLLRLPLRAHAELRMTRRAGNTDFRPAAFLTTELAPLTLPYQTRAEFYGQAGYVAGPGATGFADGQLHLLRDVWQFDLARLSFGGAAWGGIQKGAERLDIGPSLRADMRIGKTPARFSVDWRERVAGDAEPSSGVAMTLSTRF